MCLQRKNSEMCALRGGIAFQCEDRLVVTHKLGQLTGTVTSLSFSEDELALGVQGKDTNSNFGLHREFESDSLVRRCVIGRC